MKKNNLVVSMFIPLVMMGMSLSQTTLASESESTQDSGNLVTESTTSSTQESTSNTVESSIQQSRSSLPKIIGAKNRTITLNQTFDSKKGITATDAKDGILTNKIEVSGKVDTSKVGSYELTYSVVNSQHETAVEKVLINVQGKEISNYQLELPDFSLPKNSKLSDEIQKRLIIKDKDNKAVQIKGLKVTVEGNELANTLGVLPVKYLVSLPDGTILTNTVAITVYSGIRVVEPKDGYTHTGSIYEDAIDFMNYIEAYEIDSLGKEKLLESYDITTGVGIKVLKTDLDISVPGRYSIVYRLTNSLGESLEHTSYVTVVKRKEVVNPTIQANDQQLYVGDVLTKEMILSWAKTTNADQLSFEVLEDQIMINRLTNRIEKAGVYKIRYTASRIDESTQAELSVQKTITFTIKEKGTMTDSSSTVNTGNTLKKTAPTAPASNAKTKSLPKTGSKKGASNLTILGMTIVSFVFLFVVRKNRMVK